MLLDSIKAIYDNIFLNDDKSKGMHTFKRDSVVEDFKKLVEEASTTVIPTIEDFNMTIESGVIKPKDLEKVEYIKKIISVSTKIKNVNNFLPMYLEVFNKLVMNESKIADALKNCFSSSVTTDSTITTRETAVVSFVQSLNLFITFTTDLMVYTLMNLRGGVGLNKKHLNNMEKAFGNYLDAVSYFIDKDFVSEVLKYPKLELANIGGAVAASKEGDNGALEIISSRFSDMGSTATVRDGFIGNVIYHYRIWRVNAAKNRYNKLKADKEACELMLLDLKYQNEGTNDPNIDKQIKYYENLIESIQYKMDKIKD